MPDTEPYRPDHLSFILRMIIICNQIVISRSKNSYSSDQPDISLLSVLSLLELFRCRRNATVNWAKRMLVSLKSLLLIAVDG